MTGVDGFLDRNKAFGTELETGVDAGVRSVQTVGKTKRTGVLQ